MDGDPFRSYRINFLNIHSCARCDVRCRSLNRSDRSEAIVPDLTMRRSMLLGADAVIESLPERLSQLASLLRVAHKIRNSIER
jgi:hypothetical protein